MLLLFQNYLMTIQYLYGFMLLILGCAQNLRIFPENYSKTNIVRENDQRGFDEM